MFFYAFGNGGNCIDRCIFSPSKFLSVGGTEKFATSHVKDALECLYSANTQKGSLVCNFGYDLEKYFGR
jgi:hypothetical protein